jgi:hypothetical protein
VLIASLSPSVSVHLSASAHKKDFILKLHKSTSSAHLSINSKPALFRHKSIKSDKTNKNILPDVAILFCHLALPPLFSSPDWISPVLHNVSGKRKEKKNVINMNELKIEN